MRKQMARRLAAIGFAAFALAATSTQAAMVVYSNEAAFVAASGATLQPLPGGASYIKASTITTVGGELTLSQVGGLDLYSNWEKYPLVVSDRLAGPDLAISGFESFDSNVQFSGDRYAFGFGIYEASTDSTIQGCNATCVDSIFTITLKNNGSAIQSFTFAPANDVAVFWGVHTDFAFDTVEIRETTGGIDNEIFGTFYTGLQPVPLPAAAWLLLSGIAGLGVLGRRRRAD